MSKNSEIYTVIVIGKSTPQRLYDNYIEAEQEAIKLCEKEMLSAFVLKVIKSFSISDLTIKK